jgi:hypothetical protein
VSHQVDRDETVRSAQRALELAREGARGAGIAVDENNRSPHTFRFMDGDLAERPLEHRRFRHANLLRRRLQSA